MLDYQNLAEVRQSAIQSNLTTYLVVYRVPGECRPLASVQAGESQQAAIDHLQASVMSDVGVVAIVAVVPIH